jgi:hypothetical protein
MSDTNASKGAAPPQREEWEEVVRREVLRMRFGVVQIIVHDGRVMQVDATEKTRLAGKSDLGG